MLEIFSRKIVGEIFFTDILLIFEKYENFEKNLAFLPDEN